MIERWSKKQRIESLERRVQYLEGQMQRFCTCPWSSDNGPRVRTTPGCPLHDEHRAKQWSEAS